MKRSVSFFVISFAFLLSQVSLANDLTPVKLQLKWQHQFQFAGYYAAIQQGYYRQAGLDVELIEALPGVDPVEQVLSGAADFGVGTSELVLHYHRGEPVVVLGVIMQHSALALAVLDEPETQHIHDLAGDTLMIEPNSGEIFAYLKNEGFSAGDFQLVKHRHQINDLLEGRVDAMTVYTTDETYELQQSGVGFRLFKPLMGGIDFYGDNFFTTQNLLESNPQLVKQFHQATVQGWRYAMQHPQQVVDWIIDHYSQRKTADHLLYEAQEMRKLMNPTLIEPGYMNVGRWQHIVDTYQSLDLLPAEVDIEGMLYQADDRAAYERLKQQLVYVLIGSALALLLALIFYRQYHLANLRRKKFETLFYNAPVSLMELSRDGVILSWNHQAERTFQYSADEAVGQKATQLLIPPDEVEKVESVLERTWNSRRIVTSENPNLRKDGRRLICQWSNLQLESEPGRTHRVVCMARDITQEKEMAAELYRIAHYDALTGLPNRMLLLSLMKEALMDAKRHHNKLALLFIDLNGFKQINDRYGHLIGDQVLVQTGARIQAVLRENDLVGRLAGDEFLVLVKDLDQLKSLDALIEKIGKAIVPELLIEGIRVSVSASIGQSVYPLQSEEIEQLIRLADESMYQAKAVSKTLKLGQE